MKIEIQSNKKLKHWIHPASVFAFCFGFGSCFRLGFSYMHLYYGFRCLEIQLLYWRIFIITEENQENA